MKFRKKEHFARQIRIDIVKKSDIIELVMNMKGIDLNKPIEYKFSSFRFFEEKEKHVTRFSRDDILLLVYDGILRFSEDGVAHEVHAGEYYIQKSNMHQSGDAASDAPQYLYVHFSAEWTDDPDALPRAGTFDYQKLKDQMVHMDKLSHGSYPYIEKAACFYKLLSLLQKKPSHNGTAHKIERYLSERFLELTSLDELCRTFNYSKNHIINLFKTEFGITPLEYINELKLKRAMYLLEVTSKSLETVAMESGFRDYSHFYRLFCRRNGVSPSTWREKVLILPYDI